MRRRQGLPSFQILVASFHSLPTFTHDDMRFTVLRTKRPRPTPALVRAAISAEGLSSRSGHDVAAAYIDAGGSEGAVPLLGRGAGRAGGTRVNLVPVRPPRT